MNSRLSADASHSLKCLNMIMRCAIFHAVFHVELKSAAAAVLRTALPCMCTPLLRINGTQDTGERYNDLNSAKYYALQFTSSSSLPLLPACGFCAYTVPRWPATQTICVPVSMTLSISARGTHPRLRLQTTRCTAGSTCTLVPALRRASAATSGVVPQAFTELSAALAAAPADPENLTQAVYIGLGLTLVSFVLTFGVAPRFKSSFKEPETWQEVSNPPRNGSTLHG